MVAIHVKQSDQRQFLYECPATRSVETIIRDIVCIHNLQCTIQNLGVHGEQLILYGPAKPEDAENSDAENSKVTSGRRTGEACDLSGAETLRRTLTEADTYVSKNQVLHKIPLAMNVLKDHVENIRGAVMICYPMGLPSYDPVQQLLVGTFSGEELFDQETAQLWWAGKELMRDKKLCDRVGKNEKTKIIAKLQARGHGPPTREPPVDAETQKAMMVTVQVCLPLWELASRLFLFNTETGTFLKKLNFVTAILAIRLNRKRLVVVLEESTYIYDLNNPLILESIDTVPNPKGLCAFSPKEDNCYLALPASTDKGVVLIYNVNELQSHCQINAHRSPLAAMALSSDGSYIATASEQGTVIRVYLVSQASETFTFRRGTYPAAIYSLSFGPPSQLPRLLVATSSSGSVHIFTLGLMTAERNKRSTGLLATVIPTSLNDALEPPYHHVVLHNVLPTGVKSRAIICNVEEVSMVKVMGLTTNTLSYRVRILTITYNGYFNDYSVIVADDNKHPWSLERECNLLASPSEQISANFVK